MEQRDPGCLWALLKHLWEHPHAPASLLILQNNTSRATGNFLLKEPPLVVVLKGVDAMLKCQPKYLKQPFPNTVTSTSMHVEAYRDCANFIFLFVWMKLSQTSKVSQWYLLTPVSSHWSSCLMWILASLERCCVEMHSPFCTIPGEALHKRYLVFAPFACEW